MQRCHMQSDQWPHAANKYDIQQGMHVGISMHFVSMQPLSIKDRMSS